MLSFIIPKPDTYLYKYSIKKLYLNLFLNIQPKKMKPLYFLISLMLVMSYSSHAQLIDVKNKIKNQSLNRANQRTDEGIDKGLDKAEEGVKGIFKKDKNENADEEQTQDQNNENIEESNTEGNDNTKVSQKADEPKLEAYSKYDFVPGEKVIFYEDFSQDAVGDFPALWNTNGICRSGYHQFVPGELDEVYMQRSHMDRCVAEIARELYH